jgi:hypothetical protein
LACAPRVASQTSLARLGALAEAGLVQQVETAVPAGPVLLPSFAVETDPFVAIEFDLVSREAAHVYDNALAVIALVAAGRADLAVRIGDALVYAKQNDRQFRDGRLRNAYAAGVISPGVAMRPPGFWSTKSNAWGEDGYASCTTTGNVAWAALALLHLHRARPDAGYGDQALELGAFVRDCCRDERGEGGYMGGYEGHDGSLRMSWKSTEHNIDLFALFTALHNLKPDAGFGEAAEHALRFVRSMWQPSVRAFGVGTLLDGATPLPHAAALDPQTWTWLAAGARLPEALEALDAIAAQHEVTLPDGVVGLDFDSDRDGVWVEGTAQAVLALTLAGRLDSALRYHGALEAAYSRRHAAFLATLQPKLTTGLPVSGAGVPFLYYRRPHLGATAWVALAARRINPFSP